MISFYIGIASLLVAAGIIVWYFVVIRRANPPLMSDQVKINDAVFNVEIAKTMPEQARGLSYRPSLAEGTGMLFIFSKPSIQSFWMKDMNFPLDMIWIGGDKILGIVEDAPPKPGVSLINLPIYNSPDGTDKVLEVNAGTAAKDNIKVGDTVQIGKIN